MKNGEVSNSAATIVGGPAALPFGCDAHGAFKKIPSAREGKYLKFFEDWRDQLGAKVKQQVPTIDPIAFKAFATSCQTVQSAGKSVKEALALRDKIQKQKPVNQEELDQANQALKDANQALEDAKSTCELVAVSTILDNALTEFLSNSFDDTDLVTYTVIMHATPQGLADWCDQDETKAQQLIAALKDTALMRLFLESGAALNGKYGRAVELYSQFQPQDSVLQTLALATALELCDPPKIFNQKVKIDAIQRYVHYEQAYLLGELDPNFSQWTVWEMRHAINSNATEEELSWGRQSLLNYRPDHVLTEKDPHWLYNRIVKTDVGYTDVDWYKEPHSYDQILSGGGKCGPRAWYGRFICKAFGVPTWGCKQPGHAAMTRWTANGWVVCLGGGLQKSWWLDQGGLDFLLETQARAACSGPEYGQKILRLQWVASFLKEDVRSVKLYALPSPECPWYTLGMMQRRRIAAPAAARAARKSSCVSPDNFCRIQPKGDQSVVQVARADADGSGEIVIPAASCSSPTKQNTKVLFLPSATGGGKQLLLQKDAVVEYTISPGLLKDTPLKYNMTLCVCTVHRKEQPIPVKVADAVSIIKLPYTKGMWMTSEPVVVELGGSATTIRLARVLQSYGFAFKEIRLVPV